MLNQNEKSRRSAKQAIELERKGDRIGLVPGMRTLALLSVTGPPPEQGRVHPEMDACLRTIDRQGSRYHEPVARFQYAEALVETGSLESAVDQIELAIPKFKEMGAQRWLDQATARLASLRAG